MDRKHFLNVIRLGLASSLLPLLGKKAAAQEPPTDENEAFKQRWLKSLLENMDEQFSPEECVRLMEANGRDCARHGAIQLAQACKGDMEKFAAALRQHIGFEIDGDKIHLQYDKCFCHLVTQGPDRLPDTWCHCSVGWVKEMFETVTGNPVEVDLLQSIKRGDPVCQFTVSI